MSRRIPESNLQNSSVQRSFSRTQRSPDVDPEEYMDYYQDYLETQIDPQQGPQNWDQVYRSWQDTGRGNLRPWDSPQFNEALGPDPTDNYKQQLQMAGYTLHGFIASGRDNALDHQIWSVYKMENGAQVFYACKLASVALYRQMFGDFTQSVNALLKESNILIKCNHQNILKVIEAIGLSDVVTQFPFNYVAQVMEIMHGNLEQIIRKLEFEISPECNRHWFRQVISGLEYLHRPDVLKQGQQLVIVHNALRPANILFKVEGNGLVFKLADFEECYIFDFGSEPEKEDFMPNWARARPYRLQMSDPVLNEENWPVPANMHTRPNDIYLLGMLLYTCSVGRDRQRHNIFMTFGPVVVNSVYNVIYQMLINDRVARMDATQILEHPWVRGNQ